MDWNSLALKNIWHNMRRYLSYLLSSTLSVMVFSMFFIFVFNSHIGSLSALQMVAVVMVICIFIIACFAIFFIFFFHASLIRVRNKEFGLLMTLGMTPGQIGRLIFLESICIGSVALILGMALGVLGTQPFFWAMQAVLGLPDAIPFELPMVALIITAIFFGLVFLLEAGLISWRVARRTPRTLILGARVQQTPPRPSWLMVVLGLLCLGGAYDMAIQFSSMFLLNAIPIVLLAMLGTFLLFGQIMVMLLTYVRKLPLHGINVLIVSRLSYRIKDYARMLAVVTILNASVLIAMGAIYGFLQILENGNHQVNPVDMLLQDHKSQPLVANPQQIHQALVAQHITMKGEFQVELVACQIKDVPVTVISRSSFESMRTTILHVHPEYASDLPEIPALQGSQGYLQEPQTLQYFAESLAPLSIGRDHQLQVQSGNHKWSLTIERGGARVINGNLAVTARVLIVNNQLFQEIQKNATAKEQWTLQGLFFPDNQQKSLAVTTLQQTFHDRNNLSLAAVERSIFVLQLLSALLFAGGFVSLLFLFAAGSALYFKIFTQQDEDKLQFAALGRVGLRKREALRIIGSEFLILFFLPVLVAVLHSSVATIDLLFLMKVPVPIIPIIWSALGITSLIYAGCFGIYYLAALINYLRRLRLSMA
ncbi:ABC transporter permease protein YxdM [Dictyobacter alpinus]|uniref:ABC transporter permease protein YxdM n=1 Tax=Dictyobacter alpinus TaxID=2014873 RepID=A0A402B6J0_9CHLR|nr:ABC transporter permease [Dictyobacter alpinus]GCE26965.1 ABC transporter permease protein YxdM [Dictyobacter alpinus]